MTELTAKQAEIHAYLCERWHNPPSVRQMGAHFGMNVNGVMCHLKALARKGYIALPEGRQARGIRLLIGPNLAGSEIEIAGRTYRLILLVKEESNARIKPKA